MAANEEPQQSGADDLQQIRDGDVGDARQAVEHKLAVASVGSGHEDSVQDDVTARWRASRDGGCARVA